MGIMGLWFLKIWQAYHLWYMSFVRKGDVAQSGFCGNYKGHVVVK